MYVAMKKDKQYEAYNADNIAVGYFLDNRFYEYRTSTCIGFLNDRNELIDTDEKLGYLEHNILTMRDGTKLDIKEKNE